VVDLLRRPGGRRPRGARAGLCSRIGFYGRRANGQMGLDPPNPVEAPGPRVDGSAVVAGSFWKPWTNAVRSLRHTDAVDQLPRRDPLAEAGSSAPGSHANPGRRVSSGWQWRTPTVSARIESSQCQNPPPSTAALDQPHPLKADSHKVHYAKNRPIRHSLVFKSPLRNAAASFRPLRRFRRPQWPPDRRFYQWPSELGLNGHGNTRDGRLRSNPHTKSEQLGEPGCGPAVVTLRAGTTALLLSLTPNHLAPAKRQLAIRPCFIRFVIVLHRGGSMAVVIGGHRIYSRSGVHPQILHFLQVPLLAIG
jgi:hypothetical protein